MKTRISINVITLHNYLKSMECFQAFKYTSFEVAGNESSTFLFDIVLCAHVVLPVCWYLLIRFSIWMFPLLRNDDNDGDGLACT